MKSVKSAREARRAVSKMTGEEKEMLLAKGLDIINREFPMALPEHLRCKILEREAATRPMVEPARTTNRQDSRRKANRIASSSSAE